MSEKPSSAEPRSGRETQALDAEVAALDWYHTLELAPGLVTPGWFDTRSVAAQVPFPPLEGRRCLDVGTFDGFWAFEMERRGAREVVAIDVLDPAGWDWPVASPPDVIAEVGRRKAGGRGFELARDALGSSVRRLERSVYDLDPDETGRFDFVYVGSLLLHLRDPVAALERVRSVCEPANGEVLVVDAVDAALTVRFPRRPVAGLDGRARPWWWKPNVAGLVRMVEAAGFEVAGRPRRITMPAGRGQPNPTGAAAARAVLTRAGREALRTVRRGDPHAAVSGRPRR